MAKTKKKPTTKPKLEFYSNVTNEYYLFVSPWVKVSIYTEKKIFSVVISTDKPKKPYTFEKITRISRKKFIEQIEKKRIQFIPYMEIFNKAIGR